mmetsp:Transcript_13325/g.14437  ORF Transcript_13325/g.14437 Transcript_13325/m.14437 type:complete len:92 (+) Transcript_13325:195-470(+)
MVFSDYFNKDSSSCSFLGHSHPLISSINHIYCFFIYINYFFLIQNKFIHIHFGMLPTVLLIDYSLSFSCVFFFFFHISMLLLLLIVLASLV